jgi:glycosyltransferase involved in cell wall biosynthesis
MEIIVVDNFSTDMTQQIAREYRVLILVAGPERSAQVKLGVAHSRGDFIYKIDSDFVLEPAVVESAVKVALNENAVAVVIPNLSEPSVSFWSKVRYFERLAYVGSSQIEAARFIRHDIYDKVGGHDESIVAYEEHDLHNRVSRYGNIARLVGAVEWHIGEPRSLSEIVTKHWYYGKTTNRYAKRYPSIASTQLLPFRKSLFSHRTLFLRRPKIFVGLIVYSLVKYMSAAFGFLTQMV